MPNYLIELFAPPGEISPAPETAEFVVSAKTAAEARAAADRLVEAEKDSAESCVAWDSNPFAKGLPVPGMHVVRMTPTLRPTDMAAGDVLAGTAAAQNPVRHGFRESNCDKHLHHKGPYCCCCGFPPESHVDGDRKE